VRPLGLTDAEKTDLVAFMRNALTDRRVACQKAPFDHPALRVTNGHLGDTSVVLVRKGELKGVDVYVDLPEIGARGSVPGACMVSDAGTSFEPPAPRVVQIPQGLVQLPLGETSLPAGTVTLPPGFSIPHIQVPANMPGIPIPTGLIKLLPTP
jgi:hypothetical protein